MENVNLQNSNNIQVNRAIENKDPNINKYLADLSVHKQKGK
jgi:hypothetical protein